MLEVEDVGQLVHQDVVVRRLPARDLRHPADVDARCVGGRQRVARLGDERRAPGDVLGRQGDGLLELLVVLRAEVGGQRAHGAQEQRPELARQPLEVGNHLSRLRDRLVVVRPQPGPPARELLALPGQGPRVLAVSMLRLAGLLDHRRQRHERAVDGVEVTEDVARTTQGREADRGPALEHPPGVGVDHDRPQGEQRRCRPPLDELRDLQRGEQAVRHRQRPSLLRHHRRGALDPQRPLA